MSVLRRFALVAAWTLVVPACATMNVSSHVERGVDFAQFRTFAWGPADALPTGDARLDGNPFFHDHMQGAVEKQLAAKGFARSTSGTPDLLIHYHASVNQRIEVNGVDRRYGYYYDGDAQPNVLEYEQGTLVLDIVDTRTNKVVWRGWAQDSVEGMIDDQQRMESQISRAVTRMMERFPAGRNLKTDGR